jgi:glyoxylase-like metal-dependent hydrolase (beta-lactamase superfamily II)
LRRGNRAVHRSSVTSAAACTRGDLSVWLPAERVLVTGDLLVHPAPYSFGFYLSEWKAVLTRLGALPAAVIVPGHGAVQRDRTYLDLFVELLDATIGQTRDAVA